MLILSRRPGEVLRIGDDVAVTIKEIIGGKVKIAISAPRDVKIWRGEIFDRLQEQREDRPAMG